MNSYLIRYPDGTIRNELKCVCFWSGYFSTVLQNGALVQHLSTLFERIATEYPAKKFLFFMPQSDGDILLADYRYLLSETYLADLRDAGVQILIGTVAQRFSSGFREDGVDYVFLPQDDHIFQYGLRSHFILENLPKWSDRIPQMFWRGSGSRRSLPEDSGFIPLKNSNGTPFDSSTKLPVSFESGAPEARPNSNLRWYKSLVIYKPPENHISILSPNNGKTSRS